jgi:alkylated DNA repair dioxygenase AlkB
MSSSQISVFRVDGEALYFPSAFPKLSLNDLETSVDWKQNDIKMFGKTYPEPRLTAWYGPPYTYSNISWPNTPIPEFLQPIFKQLENDWNFGFNAVLLNYYRDGRDYMGWHRDNEVEIDPTLIASISLGASREMLFRRTNDHRDKRKIMLEHGSLLLMKNCQQHWEHALPKRLRIGEARLNMTFRKVRSAQSVSYL